MHRHLTLKKYPETFIQNSPFQLQIEQINNELLKTFIPYY